MTRAGSEREPLHGLEVISPSSLITHPHTCMSLVQAEAQILLKVTLEVFPVR